jgi:protein associated with RNAse G/E
MRLASSHPTHLEEESSGQHIIVRACKYDGAVHRHWPARVLRRRGSLLVLNARFEDEVRHTLLGTLERGTVSIEYYWLDRWYNVFRFLKPSGELRNFYCNINLPPQFDGQTLSYVDLDIDLLVAPDLTYQILDEEEFSGNADYFNYPEEVRAQARHALDELISLIEKRQFPFAGQL